MTANIMTSVGIEKRTVEGKPFKYRGLWFFVHKTDFNGYRITEWSSGANFKYTDMKEGITLVIESVFNKLGADVINKQIEKHIAKYGIANEPIKEAP